MTTPESEISRHDRANSIGLTLLQTTILLNGSGIIALLTYLGNPPAQAIVTLSLNDIKWSLASYLAGILAALSAMLLSFSATAATPEHTTANRFGRWVLAVNVCLSAVSILTFSIGTLVMVIGASALAKG